MDEEDFNIIIKEYNSFKQKLSEDVKSSSIKSGECYIIEDYWTEEFENSIKNYHENKNKIGKDYSDYIPDYITNINYFSTIINYLQNDKKFEFVSKNLLYSSYEQDDLESDIIAKYFSGNNKLIIELKDDKDNKNNNSLLLIVPLNKNEIQKRAFIISSKNGERNKTFYEPLIKKDKFNSKPEKIENDIVIFPFEKYSNILKLLAHFYFYEKALKKNDLSVFEENENEDYYLINNDWVVNFKKYYDYKSLHISKKGEEINYSNLNQKFEYIYSTINALNYNKKLYEKINNIDKIKSTQKSKSNISYAYIINSQMKKLIELILDKIEINLPKNKMFVKDNDIYLMCGHKIKIGHLNKNLCFEEKYIFSYRSEEILKSELNSLFESSIENYINSINCNVKKDESQEIKKNNETIGTLRILFNNNLSLNKSANIIENKVKEDYPQSNLNKRKNGIVKNKNKIWKSQMNYDSSQNKTELDNLDKIKEYEDKIKGFEEKEKKYKELEGKNKILGQNADLLSKKLKDKEAELLKEIQLKNEKIKENENLKYGLDEIKKEIEQIKGEKKKSKNKEKKIKEYENKLKEKEKILQNYEAKEKEINNENEKNKKNLLEAQSNIKKIKKEMNELNQKKNEEIQILKENINEHINRINKLEKENCVLKEKKEKKENLEKIKNEELVKKNKVLEKEIEEKQKIYDNLLIEIKEKEDELINGPQPALVGLNNIGATCFMNSTLQCLSQTKALTDFFLDKKNEDKIINNNIAIINKNDLQLCPIYAKLIKKLWDKKGPKSFSPNEFRNLVEKMNPLFKQGQAGDSKDFIIFILEQIHKELKKPNPNRNQNAVQPLNQYDKANALNFFFNDFQEQLSIISDTFFGINETTNECLNCKNIYNLQGYYNNPICYNYGIFNVIIFPLEEVKNMRNNNYQYFGYNNFQNIPINKVSLFECFCYNQKVDLFTGENRNYCNLCKQLYDSNYVSKIFSCPNVLILILNRGKNNIYDIKLDFAETIDITQFVMQPDKPRMIYNLYGVITHIGQSGPNAHFIASCKSPINNKWYRFNDAFVNPITDFQKEIHDFSTPYILFYQKY